MILMAVDLNSPSVGLDAATGGIVTGWDHVVQSLADIFATRFGDRIMREWYGSFVPNLLGRLITPDEVGPYFAAVTSAIPLALSPSSEPASDVSDPINPPSSARPSASLIRP